MLSVCGVAFTFSAAKTVFTGSKTAYDLASKARGAPRDLAALRDALRMLKRPIALCADLGTRHKVCHEPNSNLPKRSCQLTHSPLPAASLLDCFTASLLQALQLLGAL